MHFRFPFNALEILWTLTFAAHLVLLVVLMGRDRVSRFKWFTASIVLVALRLLTSKLLFGRIAQMPMLWTFIVMADLGAFIGLMVVLELARNAFGRVRRNSWVLGGLIVMAVGAAVVKFWGVWPPWKTVISYPTLQLLQLLAQKASLLSDVETILVGLLIVLFGYRYGAGWRSHTQSVAIGLSTASLSQLTVQAVWEIIAKTAVINSQDGYRKIVDLRDRLFNANNVVYVAVLAWWIVMLWMDELGARVNSLEAAGESSEVVLLPAADGLDSSDLVGYDAEAALPEGLRDQEKEPLDEHS